MRVQTQASQASHQTRRGIAALLTATLAAAALAASNTALCATGCKEGDIIAPAIQTALDARTLLQRRQFTKLDRLAEQYRTDLSPGADGKPNLLAFFNGVDNTVADCGGGHSSTEAQWKEHRRLLQAWRKAAPHSTAAVLASASFMTAYGWHARGSGYGSTVSDEGWQLFKERVQQARTQFESMDPSLRDNPEWYSGMLTIALAQGWEKPDFDALFQQARQHFPGYISFYYTQAAYYSPLWHGSMEELHQVIDDAVRATPTMGETMYARMQASQWQNDMFTSGQADWNRMAAGLEKMNQDYPGPWNQNIYARYACLAHDVYALRRLLGQIGTNVAYSAWRSKENYDQCRNYANTRLCWKWADDNTTECEPEENVPVKKF